MKIETLIHSMRFLSPEAGVPSCYLEMLDTPQKRICRPVGPSLAASLEPFGHHQNVAKSFPLVLL